MADFIQAFEKMIKMEGGYVLHPESAKKQKMPWYKRVFGKK